MDSGRLVSSLRLVGLRAVVRALVPIVVAAGLLVLVDREPARPRQLARGRGRRALGGQPRRRRGARADPGRRRRARRPRRRRPARRHRRPPRRRAGRRLRRRSTAARPGDIADLHRAARRRPPGPDAAHAPPDAVRLPHALHACRRWSPSSRCWSAAPCACAGPATRRRCTSSGCRSRSSASSASRSAAGSIASTGSSTGATSSRCCCCRRSSCTSRWSSPSGRGPGCGRRSAAPCCRSSTCRRSCWAACAPRSCCSRPAQPTAPRFTAALETLDRLELPGARRRPPRRPRDHGPRAAAACAR